jgi:hypothetical protein
MPQQAIHRAAPDGRFDCLEGSAWFLGNCYRCLEIGFPDRALKWLANSEEPSIVHRRMRNRMKLKAVLQTGDRSRAAAARSATQLRGSLWNSHAPQVVENAGAD